MPTNFPRCLRSVVTEQRQYTTEPNNAFVDGSSQLRIGGDELTEPEDVLGCEMTTAASE